MGNYKVIFKNNQPVEAILLDTVGTETRMEFRKDDEQTNIESFYIDAKSKEDAIQMVERILAVLYGENMDATSY